MNKEELDFLKESGIVGATALNYGAKLIKPGASVLQILDEVEKFIIKKNMDIAFPAQISINNVAAHFCPTNKTDVLIKEDDVVKIDVGVSNNGFIADNAKTINPNGEHKELINASRNALNSVIKILKPGIELGEIGKKIQEVISSYGFSPVRNLSGHGLGRFEIHTDPSIPNYDTKDSHSLKEGDVIAIEPFASNGAGIVYESGSPSVFILKSEKSVRSSMTREILKEIKTYNGLPFTTRWLTRKFGEGKVAFALRELKKNHMLSEHPPLLDKGKGLVSQAEHSVIIDKKPLVYTQLDDD